ncbi:MAG: biotin/lipoate A/B protein ligase family protein [Anaerolineales bacterium]
MSGFLTVSSERTGAEVYHEGPWPASRLRLGILSESASGAMNMALDEAILEAVLKHGAPPTLRFYAWDPACLSLGYAQPVNDTDRAALEREGWDLVRRPTGGKAILHTDEITYSISAPIDHTFFANGMLPSYKRISLALIAGLERMGMMPELHITDPPVPSNGNPVCFHNPSAFEITVEGKKLVGSAQLRRAGGVLQHGSVPLQGELGRICLALRYANEDDRERAMGEVGLHAITVERVLGGPITWEEAARHLTAGFEDTFQLRFSHQEPSLPEIRRSHEILEERYLHPDWTQRI